MPLNLMRLAITALCVVPTPLAAGQTVFELERRMLLAGAKCGDYAATGDWQAGVVVYRDRSDNHGVRYFNSNQQSFVLNSGDANTGEWLKSVMQPLKPGRQDEFSPAKGTVEVRLADTLTRCGELNASLSQRQVGATRWLIFSSTADEPRCRAIVAYSPLSGKGVISLDGQKPQQLLIEHQTYESVLGEFVCGGMTTGIHIVGERGALAYDETADQVQLTLAGKWSRLEPVGGGSVYRASNIRKRAAGPVAHVLDDRDLQQWNAGTGEIDPLLIQTIMPSRARSPVDPLVWLLHP